MSKAVSQAKSHTAPHGEIQARFKKACRMLLESLPSGLLKNYLPVIWKTVSDRFNQDDRGRPLRFTEETFSFVWNC